MMTKHRLMKQKEREDNVARNKRCKRWRGRTRGAFGSCKQKLFPWVRDGFPSRVEYLVDRKAFVLKYVALKYPDHPLHNIARTAWMRGLI